MYILVLEPLHKI